MREQTSRSQSIILELLKVAAFVISWDVISSFMERYGHPLLGYATGLALGVACYLLVPPRNIQLWRILLLGTLILAGHLIFVAFTPKHIFW